MRIGVDAREMRGHTTGVGRYLGGLLDAWATDPRASAHHFVLYTPGEIGRPIDPRRFTVRVIPGTGGTFWEQIQLPTIAARDRLDVWYSPAYSVPLRLRVPAVVVIHDVSFAAHPEWFRLREGARRRMLSRRAAIKARAIITISQFSRQEIVNHLHVPASKIQVIPPGLGPGASGAPAHSSPREPRVLYVGSIFNRRNVADLVRAFAPIASGHPTARLDLVGDNRSYPQEDIARVIAVDGLSHQVTWHRYVADDVLAALYRDARAFGFLSEYEGLGLTPLEAIASGAPPVLVDTAVAHETCGDAALYVPAHDITATTQALEAVLFDEPTRTRLIDAAPAVLARYDWPRLAHETLDILEAAAR